MRRTLMLLVVFALTLAACGGAAETATTAGLEDDSAPAESGTTTASEATDADGSSDATSTTRGTSEQPPATAASTNFDGPAADDFTIDLNATGTFTLSEEARPVYLVFWAEW